MKKFLDLIMKKSVIIGFCVFALLAGAAVLYGVLTHKEAGFLENYAPTWGAGDMPLRVEIGSQDQALWELNKAALEGGVDYWNSVLGFKAFQFPSEESNVKVHFQVPYEDGVMETTGIAPCYSNNRCEVKICNAGTLAATALAVKHELGHALGLAHDDFDDSLMFEGKLKEDQQYRVTDYDQKILREKYKP